MPMAQKTDAEKVAKLREMAKDKSLPQEVRNTYLDQAVKLEEKAAAKAGVKLFKGGLLRKANRPIINATKSTTPTPVPDTKVSQVKQKPSVAPTGTPAAPSPEKKITNPLIIEMMNNQKKPAPAAPRMAKGGVVAKELPKRGQRTATNMAKGGAVKKAKK